MKEERDLFRRRIFFIGYLTAKLKENSVDAILVGGEAIDLYAAGIFSTSDIDLVVNNKTVTENLLNRFGFGKKDNGLWFNSDLNIVVQVIDQSYSGDLDRLKKFRVKIMSCKWQHQKTLYKTGCILPSFGKVTLKEILRKALHY